MLGTDDDRQARTVNALIQQLNESLLLLDRETEQPAYRRAAMSVNSYVRRTIALEGLPDIVGGVKGSFPIDGDYGRWQYLNWACKFMIDSNMAERFKP